MSILEQHDDEPYVDTEEKCFTCFAPGAPVIGWAHFCDEGCKRKADLAADQAAESRHA